MSTTKIDYDKLYLGETDYKKLLKQKNAYKEAQNTNNILGMSIANNEANNIRKNNGYYGGTDGSLGTPVFNFKYDEFNYDANNDPLYKSYSQMFQRQGEAASQKSLANSAASTGGIASSYANAANAQVQQAYAKKTADMIPTLYQISRDDYNTDRNFNYQNYLNKHNSMVNLENTMYNRQVQEDATKRGIFESDRNYNRGVLESDRNFDRGVLENDRNYNRGVYEYDTDDTYRKNRALKSDEQFDYEKFFKERNYNDSKNKQVDYSDLERRARSIMQDKQTAESGAYYLLETVGLPESEYYKIGKASGIHSSVLDKVYREVENRRISNDFNSKTELDSTVTLFMNSIMQAGGINKFLEDPLNITRLNSLSAEQQKVIYELANKYYDSMNK